MRLLLDSHVPAAVTNALRIRQPGLDVQHLAQWRAGDLLEADDADILRACEREQRVWVTYDLATVPELLTRFASEGQDHAGVFLVDDATIPPEKIGALANAISDLIEEIGDEGTRNLVRFVQRPRR